MNGGGNECATVAITREWRGVVWIATPWEQRMFEEHGNEGTCYGDVSLSGHAGRSVLLRKMTQLEESHSHPRSQKLQGGGCSGYYRLAQASGLPHIVDSTLRSRQHQSAQGEG